MASGKLKLIYKFFSSLKNTGVSATLKKVVLFFSNKNAQNELRKYAFDAFYQAKYIPSNTLKTDILPVCFYSIDNMDIHELAGRKPLYASQYMPRLPLLYTDNFIERFNYHIRIAKEYQIYAFCYEITDINKFTQFISGVKLGSMSMPFCLSLNSRLTYDNIITIFNTISFDDYIKNNDKYIVILDCSNGDEIINDFINRVSSALSFMENKIELWCKIKSGMNISNPKAVCLLNTFNLNNIEPVSRHPVHFISIGSQTKMFYYSNIIKSCTVNKNIHLPQYNIISNAQDMLVDNKAAFYKYNLVQLYNWVKKECSYLRNNYDESKRFLFIDSYNNWGKYNHIVPEKHTGYAFLNTVYRAIFNKKIYGKKLSSYKEDIIEDNSSAPKICVQAHIYYVDLLGEILNELKHIPYDFDLYISTNSYKKADIIMNIFEEYNMSNDIFIDVFENRGRDIAPFIEQMRFSLTRYKYVCHIHSKKSFIDVYGNNWRDYLFNSLFGSSENVSNIIKNLEYNKGLGIVFPKAFQRLEEAAHWGLNRVIAEKTMQKLGIDIMLPVNNLVFPVGNMFWAKVEAVLPFFSYLSACDFPRERGQVDGTLAHAVERLWVYVAEYCGYTYSYSDDKK